MQALLATTDSGGVVPPPNPPHDIPCGIFTNANLIAGNKMQATAGAYTSGGSSTEILPANTAGDLQLTLLQVTTSRLFGIGATGTGGGFNRMTHCIDIEPGGAMYIFQSGVNVAGPLATTVANDVLKIDITAANVVTYLLNGVVKYTSLVAKSGSVYANATVPNTNNICENITLSGSFA